MTTTKKIPDINASVSSIGILTISFLSGNTIDINPAMLDLTIRNEALLHGLKQKLVDAGAISRDTVTGMSATARDKEAAVMEVYNRIVARDGSATWNKVRDASAAGTGGLLVAALMKMTGKTKEQIVVFLSSKSNEEKTALRRNPKVVEIIATMQAAKVSTVDTDDMLAGLMGDDTDDTPQDDDDTPQSMIALF